MATRGLYRGPAGQDEPAEPRRAQARLGLLTAGLGMQSAWPGQPVALVLLGDLAGLPHRSR